jgi:hypothetical protein
MAEEAAQISNCIDCEHHKVIDDRDPDDWFCDDDKAVICTLSPAEPEPDSRYISHRSAFRRITEACRPYNIRKESNTPAWCPLKDTVNKSINDLHEQP